jgi:nucleotide-binding universal stress UspA family protein
LTANPLFPLGKILVSTDGSENAGRAVDVALKLAKEFNSELLIVHVVKETVPRLYPSIRHKPEDSEESEGKDIVDQAVEKATSESVKASGRVLTAPNSVAEAILDAAESEKVNLIVVGTRGLGGFERLLLGSVSNAIIAHAHCSVLVVR